MKVKLTKNLEKNTKEGFGQLKTTVQNVSEKKLTLETNLAH